MKYVKHFICPYCGKELLNQNEFVECDNENEFWCDTCDTTFIIEEDGEVSEEQAFARARKKFEKGIDKHSILCYNTSVPRERERN